MCGLGTMCGMSVGCKRMRCGAGVMWCSAGEEKRGKERGKDEGEGRRGRERRGGNKGKGTKGKRMKEKRELNYTLKNRERYLFI